MNVLLLVVGLMAAAMPEPRQANVAWIAEGGFCEPETVLPLPDDTLLVSNVCGFDEPGSGYLSLLKADGTVVNWRHVEGLDAPLGMALNNSWLYVVDSNRVRIYHWPSMLPLGAMPMRVEASVANDIAVAENGTMYVTDTGKGQVMVFKNPREQSVLIEAGRFPGANGIALHDDTLYVGGKRLWKVDLKTNIARTIGPEWLADIDGIEIEDDGTLQITPVAGPLIRYRSETEFEVLGGDGISSANHGYAPELGLALIPTGFDNTVIAIRVPPKLKPPARHELPP
jgi:hypothetical protein